MKSEHMLIEGAAGVALAAMRKADHARYRRTVVLLCGANVRLATLRGILQDKNHRR
jgi:threonine dehydratase